MRVLAAFLPTVAGHGWVQTPPSRFPWMATSLSFNEGCTLGCAACSDDIPNKCGWGQPCCANPAAVQPTMNNVSQLTFSRYASVTTAHPWRSPGKAPVFSPCGLAGGGSVRSVPNGAMAPPGVKQGKDGRDDDATGPKTTWAAGSEQEVGWMIAANHGGGYAYRLAPKSSKITEDDFQKGHLKFVGDTTWIVYAPGGPLAGDPGNRTAIKATQVSEGTTPAGSQWRRLPMPSCTGKKEMSAGFEDTCDTYAQGFPPPPELPTWYGSGPQNACASYPEGWPAAGLQPGQVSDKVKAMCGPFFSFQIVDKVSIPADLTPGDYVLSWRWDCEQTPQIWANCADITITA